MEYREVLYKVNRFPLIFFSFKVYCQCFMFIHCILGNKFNLAEFHCELLRHHSVPLDVMETIINYWIAEKQASSEENTNAENPTAPTFTLLYISYIVHFKNKMYLSLQFR